jgi:SAM-dependent methyltransferase
MEWTDSRHLQVADTHFVLAFSQDDWEPLESTPERFVLAKTKNMVERHVSHVSAPVDNIIDLGIFKGGSVALFQQLFSPRRLVGVDLSEERVPALDGFIAQHALDDVVHLHYGVSQDDVERLTRIVHDEFGDQPLDLVIDDCSHRYHETKASFDLLFSRLRPGGLYLIEDWRNWPPGQAPLSDLILELVMVAAEGRGLVRELHIQGATVYVTRGDDPVADGEFNLSQAYPPGRSFTRDRPVDPPGPPRRRFSVRRP